MQDNYLLFPIGTQSRCLLTGPVIMGWVKDNPSTVSGETSLGYLALQKPSIHYPEAV